MVSEGRAPGRECAVDELIRRVLADLAALGRRCAMVGGHAVSARTEPRFTRDLDFAVAVRDDREAESLVGALVARGYRAVAIVEQEATGRLATVRLEHGSGRGVMVDLLFATAGIEPEVVADASPLTIVPGVDVPVASVGHLLALKILALDDQTRPQDRADVVALLRVASAADLSVADAALATIRQRGCDRGRDLPALFSQVRGLRSPRPGGRG